MFQPVPYIGRRTLTGVEDRRAPIDQSLMSSIQQSTVPDTFPFSLWKTQANRYYEYWDWFNGGILNEKRTSSDNKKEILKYPLGINAVRNFARKHASVLMGQEEFDSGNPLVKTRVTPKVSVKNKRKVSSDTGEAVVDEDNKALAGLAEDIIDQVWVDSNGRSMMMEQAELSQFLGGCVFQISWDEHLAAEREIPISIKKVMPDFFVPIYKADDPWDLIEVFVVYRISVTEARDQYGYTGEGTGFVTFCEHWTKKKFAILINRTPAVINGIKMDYQDHDFGFVPFVYIPHLREGNFWGSSMIEDIRGLLRELNARTADTGDAIRTTVHRKRYVRDLTGDVKPKKLDVGVEAINLGTTSPATKVSPDVFTEDAPNMPDSLVGWNKELWVMLMREGYVGPIAFGEDEGSQRSALTLAFRMWPSTSHAQSERTFWTDGLNQIARYILRMCVVKAKFLKGIVIPADFLKKIQFSQAWLPQIPRDREQKVNEVVLLFQTGVRSLELVIEMLGDVKDPKEEVARIMAWQTFQANLQIAMKAAASPGTSGTEGAGAQTSITSPKATSGTGIND